MPEAHLKLASIYYENIWNHEALQELAKVKEIDPEYPGLHVLMGKIYDKMADSENAFDAFLLAVKYEPSNSEAHYHLGTIYQQKSTQLQQQSDKTKIEEMEQAAVSEYRKAIESEKQSSAALKSHLQLGRIHKNKKERDQAKKEFMNALMIEPTAIEVLSELRTVYEKEAEEYRSNDDYENTAKKYEEILKLDPDNIRNVTTYMELGNIYYSMEHYDKAEAAYTGAIKLDPFNYDAFISLKDLENLKNMETEDAQDDTI